MNSKLDRRKFLAAATTTTAASGLTALTTRVADATTLPRPPKDGGWIDCNVWLGKWPLRHLDGGGQTRDLVEHLRSRGITQAWAGSFDGLLHKNLGAANARVAEDCRRHGGGLLVPFGTINPAMPDWEEDFRRCLEVHRLPGIRLHPAYHGYALDDPALARLLSMAADAGVIVQLSVLMEDDRMMHPLLRVAVADLSPLPDLLRAAPANLSVVLLNGLKALHPVLVRKLIDTQRVHVEISALEGVAGLETLLQQIPLDRILFGSQSPFLYFESAALKLKESVLTPAQSSAIRSGNAQRLLARGGSPRARR